jgi:hypothetical protein
MGMEQSRTFGTGKGKKWVHSFTNVFMAQPRITNKQTSSVAWVRERTIPTERHRLSANLVPTFADRVFHVVSVADPYGCNLAFLDEGISNLEEKSFNSSFVHFVLTFLKKKLCGPSPPANCTDRPTAACRRSQCQLLWIETAMWSASQISTAVFSAF